MKKARLVQGKQGLTLIEMMISLSLISVVIAVSYSIYLFGYRSFQIGEYTSSVQRNLRIAGTYITQEVRNARTLELVNAPPASALGDGFHYIYLVEAPQGRYSVVHRDTTGATRQITEPVVVMINPLFQLQMLDNAANILEVRLQGINSDFTIDTSFTLTNISGKTETENQVIKYQKP